MDKFTVLKKVGAGAYSDVYKVLRFEDEKEYALKCVKMQRLKEKELQNAINEVRLLASIKNPCVSSYKEAFFDAPS